MASSKRRTISSITSGSKDLYQEVKGCKKNVRILSSNDAKNTTKMVDPLKENFIPKTTVRKPDTFLHLNKPQPITLQKNSLLKVERKIRETEDSKFKSFKDRSELPKSAQVTLEEKVKFFKCHVLHMY